jgi:hypothetical protein
MRWLLCSNKPQVLLPGRFVYGTANVRAGCLPQGLGGEDLQLVAKFSDLKQSAHARNPQAQALHCRSTRLLTSGAGAAPALIDVVIMNRNIAATATRTRYLPSHAPP